MKDDTDMPEPGADRALTRLIPEAYRSLPAPDAARLEMIEREVLRRAPRCGGSVASPDEQLRRPSAIPRPRRLSWWLAGLWVAAASAAAWWAGHALRSHPVPPPHAAPHATAPAPQHGGAAAPRFGARAPSLTAPQSPPPTRHRSPVIFSR